MYSITPRLPEGFDPFNHTSEELEIADIYTAYLELTRNNTCITRSSYDEFEGILECMKVYPESFLMMKNAERDLDDIGDSLLTLL